MTQLELIKMRLDECGEVSRNWCLQQYITRLASRINDLEAIGYKFETEKRGRDYVYKLQKPLEQLKLI